MKTNYQLRLNEVNAMIGVNISEEYVVLLDLPSQPHTLRVVYKTNKSKVVNQIDEIDAAETTISSSYFKGRSCSGFCSDDIKDIKKLINQLKPKDWLLNDCHIDSFYKIH